MFLLKREVLYIVMMEISYVVSIEIGGNDDHRPLGSLTKGKFLTATLHTILKEDLV
jgi:hypothetical protein